MPPRRQKPFLFDYSFDDGADEARQAEEDARLQAEQDAVENAPPTFSEEELLAARAEAHALGRQEGMADAMASIEQQVAGTLDAVFARVPKVFEEHAVWVRQMEADALRLATTMMRKLAPELTRDNELPEVEMVIREAFGYLTEQPKVMIRVAGPIEAALQDKVQLMAGRVGYEGQVVLIGDPELALDDCRISWQAGAVERALDETWHQIDDLIDRALQGAPMRTQSADAAPTVETAELDTAHAGSEHQETEAVSDEPDAAPPIEDMPEELPMKPINTEQAAQPA